MIGNLTGAPELRFGPSGTAVASFVVAATERYRDAQGQFQDGNTHFQRCVAFGPLAEHIASSLNRGSRVVVVGALVTDRYEVDGDDGEKQQRTSVQLRVDDVGASLRWAEVKITRAQRDAIPSAAPGLEQDPWAAGPSPALAGAGADKAEPPF